MGPAPTTERTGNTVNTLTTFAMVYLAGMGLLAAGLFLAAANVMLVRAWIDCLMGPSPFLVPSRDRVRALSNRHRPFAYDRPPGPGATFRALN